MIIPGDVERDVKLYNVTSTGYGCFRRNNFDCKIKPFKGCNLKTGDKIEKAICETSNKHHRTATFIVPTLKTDIKICDTDVQKKRWKEFADKQPQVQYEPGLGLIFLKQTEEPSWEMAVQKHPIGDFLPGDINFGPFSLITSKPKFFPFYRTLGAKIPCHYQGTLETISDGKNRPIKLILHGFGNAVKLHLGVFKHFIPEEMFFSNNPLVNARMNGLADTQINNICGKKCFCDEKKLFCPGVNQPHTNNCYNDVQNRLGDFQKFYQEIFFTIFQSLSTNTTGAGGKGKMILESIDSSDRIYNFKMVQVKSFVPSKVVCNHQKPYIMSIMKGLIYQFQSPNDPLVVHLHCLTAYPIAQNKYQSIAPIGNGVIIGEISDVQPTN